MVGGGAQPQLMEGVQEFEIVLGTYENFVLGYSFRCLTASNQKKRLYSLVQSFANSGHLASVRAVASGGRDLVASGSADETIQLYNMRTRKEMGSLMKHDGTINTLRFHEKAHLFSGSDDGTICVWDAASWQCLKTLKGHKQAVNDLAVHSSGKLLLSVSRDKTLYTWNLIKGRPAFITKIKVEASRVAWCPGDDGLFVVVHGNLCDIYSTSVGGVVGTVDFGRKIADLSFIQQRLVLSGEEGKVNVFDLSVRDDVGRVAPSCVLDFNADSSVDPESNDPNDPNAPVPVRIKCVAYGGPRRLSDHDDDGDDEEQESKEHFLVTGSSDGTIIVWLVDFSSTSSSSSSKPQMLAKTSAGCRLTACTVYQAAPRGSSAAADVNSEQAATEEEIQKQKAERKRKMKLVLAQAMKAAQRQAADTKTTKKPKKLKTFEKGGKLSKQQKLALKSKKQMEKKNTGNVAAVEGGGGKKKAAWSVTPQRGDPVGGASRPPKRKRQD